MSNGLTLTGLIISIWVACVVGVKRGVGGVGRGVRKKRRREEKKERGSLLLFLTLHPLQTFSACHAGYCLGVYYGHEKFKMFNARIVSYRVHRFVFMSTLNSHWLDEKEVKTSLEKSSHVTYYLLL